MMELIRYKCEGRPVYVEGEYVGREGCGRDVTAEILAVPEDGQEHQVPCPCGKLTIRVQRTPAEGA